MKRRVSQIAITFTMAIAVSACSKGGDPAAAESRPMAESTPASQEATAAESPEASASELAGTQWQLVKIQSMDDNAWSPDDPSRYTLTLGADGNAYMRFDCNQGRAGWQSEGPGHIEFTLVASTNALCQDDGLSERYAAQFEYVRSYVLQNGQLFLATMADGAIIEFRPGQ